MKPSMDAEILTPIEAARYLRVHRETLYDLIRSGTIKASKVGGRWRISKASLDNYLQKDTSPANTAPNSTPTTAQETPGQRRGALSGGQEQATPKQILVVDDNPHIREFFQIVLAKRGHSVVAVPNGFDAIERVKREVYDFVFIDLVMPDIDGVETLKCIRDIDPDPTVVLITGYPEGELVTKALGMGPFVLLDKPIRVGDLLKVVER